MPGKPPLSELLQDAAKGDPILADDMNRVIELATRNVDLPDAIQDSSGIRMARTRRRGGGGAGFVVFEIDAVGPYWGNTMAVECDYVIATVLRVSCGLTGVDVGDEINVWDFDQCWLNLPIEVLVGMRGRASQMRNDLEGVVTCRDPRAAEGNCLWEVNSLCCGEEIYGNS